MAGKRITSKYLVNYISNYLTCLPPKYLPVLEDSCLGLLRLLESVSTVPHLLLGIPFSHVPDLPLSSCSFFYFLALPILPVFKELIFWRRKRACTLEMARRDFNPVKGQMEDPYVRVVGRRKLPKGWYLNASGEMQDCSIKSENRFSCKEIW